MESSVTEGLAGREIHGFRTMEDLDIANTLDEAKTRWLRPNEIHAILCNYKYFNIHVKPLKLPQSGTVVLFDRKMLRNFRKDGHSWKKKNDGKTVKEAHEHLKVGNEERIHVYYAHGQEIPTFVRRCYWLLDKTLEHIVLVHYRETKELRGSPTTPVNSNSSSALSDPPTSWILSEESDSGATRAYDTEPGKCMTIDNHELRLHEINTLEWEELLVPDDRNKLSTSQEGKTSCFIQQHQFEIEGYKSIGNFPSTYKLPDEEILTESLPGNTSILMNTLDSGSFQKMPSQMNPNFQRKDTELVTVGTPISGDILGQDGLQTQDSFGRWMKYIMTESPGSVDDPVPESSLSLGHQSYTSSEMIHQQPSVIEQIFSITDVSPAWAFASAETKILVVGFFHEGYPFPTNSNLYCVCGDARVPAEVVQSGVFRCLVPPHTAGSVNFYMSFDDNKPISQIFTFEYRDPLMHDWTLSSEDESRWEDFRVQMRLAHLLFSTSKSLNKLCGKVSQNSLKQAKVFVHKTSHITGSWENLIKSIKSNRLSFTQAKDSLFEVTLRNRLQEWLLEKVFEGFKTSDCDDDGQGAIHLCAILGYTWAVYPFSWSGLSLDFRDKFGWTALHWAAYCGREKMVATLLSAGAKLNLVTDPTPENPGGCTAADLAFNNGYEGLAAYLAEKGLVEHFKEMTLAGNVSGSLQTTTAPNSVDHENLSEEELYLKDTLAAYRTAADAAARIHAAFREQSLKQRAKAVKISSPEDDARTIIAAMKIQHAFRNYDTRKKMSAAVRIQHRFRTWKTRREFLNMRRQTIKIQAVFRGYQVRKQYKQIIWSVGVVEKAILRWRLKRKGFRGLQIDLNEPVQENNNEESDVEEDFFRASRKQAEERVERSVIRVQSMFRSKKAQQDYQRMKFAHNQARMEYEGQLHPDTDIR